MPESPSRLPARPSLEQLRKQAKDLLRDHRAGRAAAVERFRATMPHIAGAPSLADAQLVIAREYGFDSWPKLARHVVSVTRPALEPFYKQAEDLVAAVTARDDASLKRLGEIFGRLFTPQELRAYVAQRIDTLGEPTLADAQLLVARQYGFDTWAQLVENAGRPPGDPRSAPLGMSAAPPFYRIDWKDNVIAVRGPLSEKDWDTIGAVMKETGIAGLSSSGQMTDAGLERLAAFDHVTRLDLGGCTQLTDAGLRHLARMPQLQDLDLSGWESPITDRGLEVLRHLRELRRFELCWPRRISDAGAANLRFCDRLESVNLLGTPTGDGAIEALAGKARLRHLATGRQVTDAGLQLVHALPVFRTWQGGETRYGLMSADAEPNRLLIDGPFTDAGLATLAGLEGLFGLTIFWHSQAMTADGFARLAALPHLGFLGAEGKLCDDVAMRHIAALPRLRMLVAQGTVATNDGFTALSRSQTLEYIWGRECPQLGERGFTSLATMPALRGLGVSCRNVDEEALATLPRFPALRELMPMDVSDCGFRHVGRCERLEALWCMYCRETGDEATEHIAGLTRLKRYYAGATQITDRSLEILSRLASLEQVTLWNTAGVTNAGVAALARLPRLREVTLDGLANVTREGAAMFGPGVHVSYSS